MVVRKYRVSILVKYFLAIFITGILLVPSYQKGILELKINTFHHPFFDAFFAAITHLGDGIILVVPILIFLFYNYCYFALISFSALAHLVLVHVAKKWLFPGVARPAEYLKDIPFYEVPGIQLHHWGSFPSGHTTTAFMLASFFFLALPRKYKLHSILMGMATIIGLSRVYLMQHFLVDIWAEALLGIGSTIMSFIIVLKYFSKKIFHKKVSYKNKE